MATFGEGFHFFVYVLQKGLRHSAEGAGREFRSCRLLRRSFNHQCHLHLGLRFSLPQVTAHLTRRLQ